MPVTRRTAPSTPQKEAEAPRQDANDELKEVALEQEFGGAVGATMVMIFSHFIVLYVWLCLHRNGGALTYPTSLDNIQPWFQWCVDQIMEGAAPTWYTVGIYTCFLLMEAVFVLVMPGMQVKGLPVPTEGNKQHVYECNGVSSWYATLAVVAALHYTDTFSLVEVADNAGSLAVVAMLFADATAVVAYITGVASGNAVRMSGNPVYDFFMGAWLNPRLIGNFDLKFWAETRVAWIMLFLLTLSAAVKQYSELGYNTWPMYFMLLTHYLYGNACMKGEECIPTTWDIFYEKWGWMLIYWNFCGVPFVYSASSFFIMAHPDISHPSYMISALFVVLLASYYVWDTAQSQRNRFRMQLRGTYKPRGWLAFPQLPWGTLENPKYLRTKCGSTLLIDGWWAYARKIHYTCDVVFALSWGLVCGFTHALPYFYFLFFVGMIAHRYQRDVARCATKYGEDWDIYCWTVPYVFVPGVF